MNYVLEFVANNWVYLAVGEVLATVVGTCYALYDDDERNDGVIDWQGLVLCILAFAFWPAVLAIVALAIPCALIAAACEWVEDRDLHPMTWVFAWPYKVAKLIGRWRFRRKVRKMIETGDTRIMDEETGKVEKEQE